MWLTGPFLSSHPGCSQKSRSFVEMRADWDGKPSGLPLLDLEREVDETGTRCRSNRVVFGFSASLGWTFFRP